MGSTDWKNTPPPKKWKHKWTTEQRWQRERKVVGRVDKSRDVIPQVYEQCLNPVTRTAINEKYEG